MTQRWESFSGGCLAGSNQLVGAPEIVPSEVPQFWFDRQIAVISPA
jgi:hypothetical protein